MGRTSFTQELRALAQQAGERVDAGGYARPTVHRGARDGRLGR